MGTGEPHVIQVLQHAVHVAVRGVDIGEYGPDFGFVRKHPAFQALEPFDGPVLRVLGMVLEILHVFLVVVKERRNVVQL